MGVFAAGWNDRKGKTHTAPLSPGGDRVMLKTKLWMARYRDAEGRVHDIPTGCGDDRAARHILAELVRRAEYVRAGIAKHDERGRTVDLHALRHTFGTHLSKNGCLLYTSPSPRDLSTPRMPSSA